MMDIIFFLIPLCTLFAIFCTAAHYLFKVYHDPGVCVEVGKSRIHFDLATKSWKSRVKVTIKTNNGHVWVTHDHTRLFQTALNKVQFRYNNWDPEKGIYIGGETFEYPLIVGKESVLVMEVIIYFAVKKDIPRIKAYLDLISSLVEHENVTFSYENPWTNKIETVEKNICISGFVQQFKLDYESIFGTSLDDKTWAE